MTSTDLVIPAGQEAEQRLPIPPVKIPLRSRDGEVRAFAIIDPADVSLVVGRSWSLGGHGYAQTRNGRRAVLLMHRVVLGLTSGDGFIADHINRDKLDNRRTNLRRVDRAANAQNSVSSRGTSMHRNVSWHTATQKWLVTVTANGQRNYLGLFETETEAASVAAAFRAKHVPCSPEAQSNAAPLEVR